MYESLLKTISNLVQLQKEDIVTMESFFKIRSVKKGTVLIDKDDFSDSVFFVNSGYLRYYKIVESGEELTIHLSSPGEFAASYSSFVDGTRSEEILHALTDAELLSITKTSLEELYSSDIKWQIFGRKLMEVVLLEKEKRIINQISLTAQERYIKLLDVNPELINNVPIQYLASFIGIKPESLSRIRKQIFLTNVK